MRTFTIRAAIAAAAAMLVIFVTGTSSASAASVSNPTVYGCRSGYACLYTNQQSPTTLPAGPHTDYYYYGYRNFSDVQGNHWLLNNQTGGAKVYLCTGYNGTSCGGTSYYFYPIGYRNYIPAGYGLNTNLTPINSIKLVA